MVDFPPSASPKEPPGRLARRPLGGALWPWLATLLPWLLPLAGLSACAGESKPESRQAASRLEDPRASALREALEQGQLATAKSLLETLGDSLGVEKPLLEARLALATGDAVLALRLVETAKTDWPKDSRPYATACELFASLDRLEAAQAEYEAGVALAGRTPDLIRAQGILGLCTPGQVELGVRLVEAARAADPQLPFCAQPLSRGRAVAARLALGERRTEEGRAWLAAGLKDAPQDAELRTLQAESDLSARRFSAAASAFEALFSEGEPVKEDLLVALRAQAADALIKKDRVTQITCYLRMLELGVPREELGYGADVLSKESQRRIEQGLEAYDLGERLVIDGDLEPAVRAEAVAARVRQFEKAEALFRSALDFDPDSLEARHRLGEALYRMGNFQEAAREWEAVALLARGSADEDSGVHLNIARAWRGAGYSDRARRVLTEYMAEHPRGEFVDQAESLLAQLPAQEARSANPR